MLGIQGTARSLFSYNAYGGSILLLLAALWSASLMAPTRAHADALAAWSLAEDNLITCGTATPSVLQADLNQGGAFSFTGDCVIYPSTPLIVAPGITVSLDGAGHHVTFDGQNATQLFQVAAGGTLTLNELTLKNGFAYNRRNGTLAGAFGGAINNAGTLTIERSALVNNSAEGQGGSDGFGGGGGGGAAFGGAIYTSGSASSVTILTSTLTANSAVGGAGGIGGPGDPFESPFGGYGGGLYGDTGKCSTDCAGLGGGGIGFGYGTGQGGFAGGWGTRFGTDSGFGGNGGFGGGGGGGYGSMEGGDGGGGAALGAALFNAGGTVTIVNSTIVSNTATAGSAYIYASPGRGMGAVFNDGGMATLSNSIVDGNTGSAHADTYVYSGSMTSKGYNLFGDDSGVTSAPTDIIGQPPLLGPLQDNGGPIWTMAPLPGSPLVGNGDPAACQSDSGVCDIGAYGYSPPTGGGGGSGGLPPTATPELSSSELLAISLLPIGVVFVCRRRARRRS